MSSSRRTPRSRSADPRICSASPSSADELALAVSRGARARRPVLRARARRQHPDRRQGLSRPRDSQRRAPRALERRREALGGERRRDARPDLGVRAPRLVGARALRRHSEHRRRRDLAEPALPLAGARARAHDVHRRSVRVVRDPQRRGNAQNGRRGLREFRLRRYRLSSSRRHRARGRPSRSRPAIRT